MTLSSDEQKCSFFVCLFFFCLIKWQGSSSKYSVHLINFLHRNSHQKRKKEEIKEKDIEICSCYGVVELVQACLTMF